MEQWWILGLEQEKYKRSLEYLVQLSKVHKKLFLFRNDNKCGRNARQFPHLLNGDNRT